MTIKIGERTLTTRRPSDLDVKLLETSGCNADEILRHLGGTPSAGTVARALLPFIADGDRTSVPELADEIAAAGTADVAVQVAALLAPTPEAKSKPE